MSIRGLALVAALVTTLAGCAATAEDDASSDDSALTGGTNIASHPEVGRVLYTRGTSILDGNADDSRGWCSGTLITQDIVVTDRSCQFHQLVADSWYFYIDKDTNGDGKLDHAYRAKAKVVEALTPRNQRNSERGQFFFLKLDTKVPASIAKPATVRRTGVVDGERVLAVGYGDGSLDGLGTRNAAAFAYHFGKDMFGETTSEGPHVLNGGADYGCAVFDAHGQLAAMGASQGSTNWFFGHPDWFAEPGKYYDEFSAFVAELERK